jgi:hypothetical protein
MVSLFYPHFALHWRQIVVPAKKLITRLYCCHPVSGTTS